MSANIDYWHRLDLKEDYIIRLAIENDLKPITNSDSHHPNHFGYLQFGLGKARRD
ncbi:MAG TPA: hypothetical protein VLA48_08585 [Nitrososphaeraceae archaeon]|nr:hypothetical protein [Nitrososphaeraceae archaeon]